jgi:WD40 repeat protein
VPSRAGEVKLFNVGDGALVREFKDLHSDTVYGVDFSADGIRLATCGADRFVRVVDVASGKIVKNFEGHTHHALGVTWKRDGRTLASAGADKTIKLWDMITGEQKKNLENMFRKEVTSVRYVPGQNTILACGGDATLRIVREEGGDARQFGGDKGFQQCAALSADGKIIAGGGEDGTLRVYDSEGKTWFEFPAGK